MFTHLTEFARNCSINNHLQDEELSTVDVVLKSYINVIHEAMDYVMPQVHSCYEVVLYRNGSGKSTIGEELYDFSDMSLAIITPNQIHDELTVTRSEVFCCLFDYEGEIPLVGGVYQINKKSQNKRYGEKIVSIMNEIRDEMAQKRIHHEDYINFLMGQLLIVFSRLQTNKKSQIDSIRYVKFYIKENYSSKINFNVLANHIGYSPDHFRHIFTERVGISPSKYLLNIRIKKAKELLLETDDTVNKIGKMTGFPIASRFIEVFRNETNYTPKKYRECMKKISINEINF